MKKTMSALKVTVQDLRIEELDGLWGGAMFTLNSTEVHCVAYAIGSYCSNAWKSGNPHSGIYEAETSRTLDALNCGYPACNQGGVLIIEISEPGISSVRLPDTDSGRRDLADPE